MRMKGTAVRSRLEFIRASSGDAGLTEVLVPLTASDRRALELALPTSWVPVDLVDRLDARILQVHHGSLVVARRYGAFSARQNLSKVYRAFLEQSRGAPLAFFEGIAALHPTFYDHGAMRVTESAAGRCRVEVDYAGCGTRFRCQVSLGFFEASLQMLNVEDIEVDELDCQLDGAPTCAAQIRWRPEIRRGQRTSRRTHTLHLTP